MARSVIAAGLRGDGTYCQRSKRLTAFGGEREDLRRLGGPIGTQTNGLIDRLSRRDQSRLLGGSDSCILGQREVLSLPRTDLLYVHFPLQGFISLSTTVDPAEALEVALIGREGVVGSHVALGVRQSPFRTTVGSEGSAWRIRPALLRTRMSESPSLAQLIRRYAHVLAMQIATAVACVHFHLIRPRLARLLLMIRDRCHSDTFTVTQAHLGEMLGVRRVGISAEAASLQEEGVIRYSRGSVSILDPGALRAIACDCYDADRRTYLDLLSPRAAVDGR